MGDNHEPVGEVSETEGGGPVLPVAPPPMPPDEPPPPPRRVRKLRRRPPSLVWPLVLIGAGVFLLLSNLGYLPPQSWNILWRLWPLLLVAIGVDLLIGRRSVIGGIVSAVVILMLIGGAVLVLLFAQNVPALVELTGPVEWRTEHIEYPLEGVERASISINYTSLPCYLSALSDSPSLIEGDITHRGQLVFDANVRQNQAGVELDSHHSGIWLPDLSNQMEGLWDVRVSPSVPLDLALDAGSGRCDLDLTGLQIEYFFLDSGSGSVDLVLPSGGTFDARIASGSGRLVIVLPESVGMQVQLDSGSGAFRADERFRLVDGDRGDDGMWETEDFRSAEHRIVLKIDQGSGSINIR